MADKNFRVDDEQDQPEPLIKPDLVPKIGDSPSGADSPESQIPVEVDHHLEKAASPIDILTSPAAAERAAALRSLAQAKSSTPEILRALEQTAALDALSAPAHRSLQWQSRRVPVYNRKIIHTEIAARQADNLITSEQAAILRQRYPLTATPTVAAASQAEKAAPRSLKNSCSARPR